MKAVSIVAAAPIRANGADTDDQGQMVAYLLVKDFVGGGFRNNTIDPCAGWNSLVYHIDNDGGQNSTGPDHFSREPAYACFTSPLNRDTLGVDFLIAAYHAR